METINFNILWIVGTIAALKKMRGGQGMGAAIGSSMALTQDLSQRNAKIQQMRNERMANKMTRFDKEEEAAWQKDADEATRELLKGCRWLLVKNRENLTKEQEKQSAGMLDASSELKRCCQLKETFRDLFNQNLTVKAAEKRLRRWIAQVEAMPFKALKSFAATLRNWWEQILNYFDGRFNNGFAEGVNLKIKMLNRRGYGYRNFSSFRLHVLVALEPFFR